MLSGAENESHGFLLDGESPQPQPVRLALLDASLRFTPLAMRRAQHWDFAAIDWEATRLINNQLRIKLREFDQWLVVTAPALIDEIQAERRHWSRGRFWHVRPDLRTAIRATLGTLFVCVTLWLSWPALTKPLAGLVPERTRQWLGQTAQTMTGMNKVCTTPEGAAALNSLVTRLTQSDPALQKVEILVVRSPMVNALTLANDRILLTSAIIKQAGGPDEVAGMLAHELGHVAHRHVLRTFLGQTAMKALILIFTGAHGDTLNTVNDLSNSANTRAFESEADQTAIALLRDAHIATQGLGEFFARMQRQEGIISRLGVTRYLSSHPPSAEREKLMREIAPNAVTPALDARQWQALRTICGADGGNNESGLPILGPDEDVPQLDTRTPLPDDTDAPELRPLPPLPELPQWPPEPQTTPDEDESAPLPRARDPNEPQDL